MEGGEAWHLDLYRIGDAGELEFLGLDEGAAELWLVEWPERGGAALPRADLQVDLSVEGNGRAARLVAASPQGQQWLERVATEGELTASSLQSD